MPVVGESVKKELYTNTPETGLAPTLTVSR